MYKFFFFLLCTLSSFGQKLHHQTISSQGGNVELANKMIVSQSIGQSGAIGNYNNSKVFVGQGYIQSYSTSKKALPVAEAVSVIVYPNPVIDFVNFKFSSNLATSVVINLFDTRGRLVYSQKSGAVQDILTVNLSSLSEGVYFTKIETPNYTFSTKILKSK